jgi:hypothetical protein
VTWITDRAPADSVAVPPPNVYALDPSTLDDVRTFLDRAHGSAAEKVWSVLLERAQRYAGGAVTLQGLIHAMVQSFSTALDGTGRHSTDSRTALSQSRRHGAALAGRLESDA